MEHIIGGSFNSTSPKQVSKGNGHIATKLWEEAGMVATDQLRFFRVGSRQSQFLMRGLLFWTLAIVDHQSGEEENIKHGHKQIRPISESGAEKEE